MPSEPILSRCFVHFVLFSLGKFKFIEKKLFLIKTLFIHFEIVGNNKTFCLHWCPQTERKRHPDRHFVKILFRSWELVTNIFDSIFFRYQNTLYFLYISKSLWSNDYLVSFIVKSVYFFLTFSGYIILRDEF